MPVRLLSRDRVLQGNLMVGGYGVLLWPAALSTGWLLWPPQLYAIWRSPAYPPNGGSLLAERPIFARALVLSRGDFAREIRRRLLIAPVCCRRLCFGRFGHLLAPSVTALPRIVPASYASRNMASVSKKAVVVLCTMPSIMNPDLQPLPREDCLSGNLHTAVAEVPKTRGSRARFRRFSAPCVALAIRV